LVLGGAPFALALYFAPETFRGLTFAWGGGGREENADAVAKFCARNGGANLTSIGLVLLMEAKELPKTCLFIIQLLGLLLILPLWRGATQQHTSNKLFHRNSLLVHVILLAITCLLLLEAHHWECQQQHRPDGEHHNTTNSPPPNVHVVESPAPPLEPEATKVKKD
jgi:hypothetical protein